MAIQNPGRPDAPQANRWFRPALLGAGGLAAIAVIASVTAGLSDESNTVANKGTIAPETTAVENTLGTPATSTGQSTDVDIFGDLPADSAVPPPYFVVELPPTAPEGDDVFAVADERPSVFLNVVPGESMWVYGRSVGEEPFVDGDLLVTRIKEETAGGCEPSELIEVADRTVCYDAGIPKRVGIERVEGHTFTLHSVKMSRDQLLAEKLKR